MELTKEQRHEAYKWALKDGEIRADKKELFFICNTLAYWYFAAGLTPAPISSELVLNFFHELHSKKPVTLSSVWFELYDYQSRFDVLAKCIEETAPCT